MFEGECDLAAVSVNAIQRASVLKDVNRNCQLQQTGRVIHFQQGGLALKADSGTKCTSLIQDVFHVHLSDMKYDGTLRKLTEKYLSNMQEMTCKSNDGEGSSGSINDNRSLEEAILSLKEMSGAFMNHAMALILAVIFGINSRMKRKKEETGGGGGSDGYFGQDYASRSNNSNGVRNNSINDNRRNGNRSKWNGTSSSSSSLSRTIRNMVKKNDMLTKNGEKLSKRLEEISEKDETISRLLSSISKQKPI